MQMADSLNQLCCRWTIPDSGTGDVVVIPRASPRESLHLLLGPNKTQKVCMYKIIAIYLIKTNLTLE